jgi:para-aminobenzoate synthetase/4-amino-4-deoxychorismate lyase
MSGKIMTEGCVILHNASTGQWLHFESPYQIIKATQPDEIIPALKSIESLVDTHRWHAAGFIGYEASGAFDRALCTHPAGDFPLLWFGLYPQPEEFSLPTPNFKVFSLGEVVPSVQQSEYEDAIRRIKEYISSGDTYQVNYTLRLRFPFSGDAWHLFLAMVRAQPSGYSAWVDTGRYVVCSASPELFFRLDGNQLTCKPMKGTVRRGRTLDEDNFLAEWLQSSEKNRAENLMIVDMIRNDLGRIADIGSVNVPRLFEVERHPTLWQMTSTVTACCNQSFVKILEALFPCASITGAPKIRTTHIITELEPNPRHLYTGSIGFISPDRFMQFNVAIRTAIVDRNTGQAEYGAGGGIVSDSDCRDEYKEALLKARVLTEQQADFSLLETLRWTPEEAYFLLDYHLRRLANSAIYFDYPADLDRVRSQLFHRVADFCGKPQRVRLLVNRSGDIDIQAAPLSATASASPLRIKIAADPINSAETFLYHKTTHRRIYEDAQRSCPDCDDVLLWNERGEITESCIANIVVEINGQRLTPPVNSGLLAGTFRAWLLDQGKIRERTVRIDDLARNSKIYLINSVRKWQEAILL